jgi:hypothetical protein
MSHRGKHCTSVKEMIHTKGCSTFQGLPLQDIQMQTHYHKAAVTGKVSNLSYQKRCCLPMAQPYSQLKLKRVVNSEKEEGRWRKDGAQQCTSLYTVFQSPVHLQHNLFNQCHMTLT